MVLMGQFSDFWLSSRCRWCKFMTHSNGPYVPFVNGVCGQICICEHCQSPYCMVDRRLPNCTDTFSDGGIEPLGIRKVVSGSSLMLIMVRFGAISQFTSIMFLVPVIVVLFAWLVVGEVLPMLATAGVLIVLFGPPSIVPVKRASL